MGDSYRPRNLHRKRPDNLIYQILVDPGLEELPVPLRDDEVRVRELLDMMGYGRRSNIERAHDFRHKTLAAFGIVRTALFPRDLQEEIEAVGVRESLQCFCERFGVHG